MAALKTSGRVLPPPEAAQRLGKSTKTLRNWRAAGIGPSFVGHGRGVGYTERAIEEYLAAHTTRTGAH